MLAATEADRSLLLSGVVSESNDQGVRIYHRNGQLERLLTAEGNRPVGVITKRELVEPLANRVATAEESPRWCEPAPQTAGEVMQRISISLGQHAIVSDAAPMMALELVHHIPIVTPEGSIAGLVSSLDVVEWLAGIDTTGRAASGRLASLPASAR